MTTGFVFHELYMWHNTGNFAGVVPFGNPVQPYEHADHPETKRRIKNLLDVSGLTKQLNRIEPREATDEEILRFHTPGYLAKIASLNDQYAAEAGFFTPMGRGSFEIAKLSAGGVIEALDAVVANKVSNAYALVRPPGHHAMPDMGMGSCIFGNAVIAGEHALQARKLGKIATVDWDVHHGNGTQAGFWENPQALTISIHQDAYFPDDTGTMSETGAGKGDGFNINVPLPPGSGVGAYEAVFERVVIPALAAFKPDLIIVPCGFDAGAWDPHGRQMMTSTGYRSLTRQLMEVADDVCEGRIVMCHEGGYNGSTVPFFGLAVLETLSGIDTHTEDPFDEMFNKFSGQDLQPHQDARVEEAQGLVANLVARC